MIETMGDFPIKERKARSHNSTSDYYVNEDGSVTRKTLVNDEVISKVSSASKTKKHIPTNKKSNLKNCHSSSKSQSKLYQILLIGTILHVFFTIVVLVLIVINTTDTFSGYCEGTVGLFFLSLLIYFIITRPILNKIVDLFL